MNDPDAVKHAVPNHNDNKCKTNLRWLFCCFVPSVQMKVYTQNRTQESLSVQQRFGLGCVSGTVAHAAFYPLEVSENSGRSECFTFLSCHIFHQNS